MKAQVVIDHKGITIARRGRIRTYAINALRLYRMSLIEPVTEPIQYLKYTMERPL